MNRQPYILVYLKYACIHNYVYSNEPPQGAHLPCAIGVGISRGTLRQLGTLFAL